ncbi:MAG TPA: VOC family protein [Terriglobales bacterium]|jgi:PhnB protein|nr:VOC family protein [Terriglobales bacterium]
MPKRSLSDQFNQAVQALLARPDSLLPSVEAELAPLVSLAAGLRDLPRDEFKLRLKSELQRSSSMATQPKPEPASYIREGFHTITPYLIVQGAAEFSEFLKAAFGAKERLRVPLPDGSLMHAEADLGGYVIEFADSNEQFPPRPAELHLYVSDADATYARAVAAGATSMFAPVDQDYGDREAYVKDKFGNQWYIATPISWTPPAGGPPAVQPVLHPRGADQFMQFLKDAFDAEILGDVPRSPEGAVLHVTMRIGDNTLEIGEAHGQFQPVPCALHLYVPDTDALYERALRAGATSTETPSDKPYGDRSAGVKDAFGFQWFLATHVRDITLPLPIRRLDFFTIRTANLERARRFYVDTLQFPVLDEKKGEYFRIAIAGVPVCVDFDPAFAGQQPNQIGVTVTHLGMAREGLRARKIRFTEGQRANETWLSVKDPDGHEILFIEEK